MRILTRSLILILASSAFTQIKDDPGKVYYQHFYQPGDWVTYASTRFSTSVAVQYHKAYIGTLGGMLRYDISRSQFSYPITTSNGLIDNAVVLLAVDPKTDFVWIITQNGIHIFNPFTEQVTSEGMFFSGLSGSTATGIAFDQTGTWIRTNGLTYSCPSSILILTTVQHDKIPSLEWVESMPANVENFPHLFPNPVSGYRYKDYPPAFVDEDFREYPVTNFTIDFLNNLWVSTAGAGTWFGNKMSGVVSPLNYGLFSSQVSAMTWNADGMWYGGHLNAENGLTFWPDDQNQFTYYPASFRTGLNATTVNDILVDSSGTWLATDQGLYTRTKSESTWRLYGTGAGLYHANVHVIRRVADQLLIGTESGLNRAYWTKKGYQVSKVEIPQFWNVAIFRILQSDEGIWLGTSNGIYLLDSALTIIGHYNISGFEIRIDEFVSQPVRGLTQDAHKVYFVSDWNLVAYVKASKAWTTITVAGNFLNVGVNDAASDDQNLWIATNQGALRYIKSRQKWIYYSQKDGLAGEEVLKVLPDGPSVWFGTNNGATEFYWGSEHLRE